MAVTSARERRATSVPAVRLLAAALLVLAPRPARPGEAAVVRAVADPRIAPAPGGDPPPRALTDRDIRATLDRFVGRACDPGAAARALEDRYRFLGYVPSATVGCEDGVLRALVLESRLRVSLITFEPADVSRIGLRVDEEFEETRRLYPVTPAAPRELLLGLLRTRPGDLYNTERYRRDREALSRFGYTVAFLAGKPESEGTYAPGAYLILSLAPPPEARPYLHRETNYIGGTAGYAPRSGATLGLTYQKDEVFGRYDRLTVAPTYNDQAGGEIRYLSPLLEARTGPRRLYDLDVDLYSSFLPNRVLGAAETGERRTGAAARLGLRPLGGRASGDLRLAFGLRHERISLAEAAPGGLETDLTLLEIGAAWDLRRSHRWPSLTGRIVPDLDVSVDRLGGSLDFVRTGLDTSFHLRFPAGLEGDVHFLGGTVGGDAPVFELWSLGGPGSVRGFRQDEILGRRLAALQTEIWFPIVPRRRAGGSGDDSGAGPGGGPADEVPFEPRVARLLKGAVFVDAGTVADTLTGGREDLAGAGIGIRFVVPHQPLVVRIDYGWGLGPRGGDSYPYLSIGYHF